MHEGMPVSGDGAGPLVSVCIPTYGHALFIEACVRSVLNQRFDGRMEVLVGEDASPDMTRDILVALAAEDPRIRPVLRDRNIGPTRNLSDLVRLARGEFIAHLDGDDAWSPGKLAGQLRFFSADARLTAVYANAQVISVNDEYLGRFNAGLPDRIDRRELLRRGNMLCHSSLLYRASARDAILGIAPPYIDYRLHIRFLESGTLGYIDECLVSYRWRTPGSMISALPRAVIEGHLDAFGEAARIGASAAELRGAIAVFWGKVVVKGILSADFRTPLQVAKRLGTSRLAGITQSWLFVQSLVGLGRAIQSAVSRKRRGVFFP